MADIKTLVSQNAAIALPLAGLLLGLAFGAVVQRTNFCTMGALSDVVNLEDWRRLRAWLLAIAVAILGTQLAAVAGLVDIAGSMYAAPRFNWAGHLIGGALFGFGMVFAGGCASRTLARLGGGDLRSLVVLVVMGIVAYATIGGVLGPARASLEQASAIDLKALGLASSDLGALLASRLPGLAGATWGLVAGAAIAAALAWFCFKNKAFRSAPTHIGAGVGIGLLVTAGWVITGLAFDELTEKPVAPISLTFVRPAGDSLEWLMRATALGWPGFGVATVAGTILGAFLSAVAVGRFRLATFASPADTVRSLFGAALMGIGGVMALGCTVGQGITGLSTLALGSFVTFAAIVAGGLIGLGALERAVMAEAEARARIA